MYVWLLVSGQWSVGAWSIVLGQWSIVIGYWSVVNGYWLLVCGQQLWDLRKSHEMTDH
jgi:hypothetical protein